MFRHWIVIYLSIGATFGFLLARPGWLATLAGASWPHDWNEAKPLAFGLFLAMGHGVLRAYLWLPSVAYHLWTHQLTFDQWLVGGVW
jgi:hypothetical protein